MAKVDVEPGQLRRWTGAPPCYATPFLILSNDRSKKDWNVEILLNGEVSSYHERIFKSYTEVVSG